MRGAFGSVVSFTMPPRTILVADDDRLLRESLCDALSDLGFMPTDVGCGRQAIAVLNERRCDLLLSDVDMPDMTGFQLLSWVAEHPSSPLMPTVLMSARADGELDRAALAAGARALLPKPVGISVIQSLVQTIFNRPGSGSSPPLRGGPAGPGAARRDRLS